MAYWLDRGVSGFRVDMAFSLVKDELWAEGVWPVGRVVARDPRVAGRRVPGGGAAARGRRAADGRPLARSTPTSSWSSWPSTPASRQPHSAGLLPFQEPREPFFDAAGRGSAPGCFLDAWARAREADPGRPIVLATADHDFTGCAPDLTREQLAPR
ncbi:hypothetical protein GCM10020358_20010 [Amorphoplanes nipponensis]